MLHLGIISGASRSAIYQLLIVLCLIFPFSLVQTQAQSETQAENEDSHRPAANTKPPTQNPQESSQVAPTNSAPQNANDTKARQEAKPQTNPQTDTGFTPEKKITSQEAESTSNTTNKKKKPFNQQPTIPKTDSVPKEIKKHKSQKRIEAEKKKVLDRLATKRPFTVKPSAEQEGIGNLPNFEKTFLSGYYQMVATHKNSFPHVTENENVSQQESTKTPDTASTQFDTGDWKTWISWENRNFTNILIIIALTLGLLLYRMRRKDK